MSQEYLQLFIEVYFQVSFLSYAHPNLSYFSLSFSRGIYLASLLYNEDDDRVLVTMDENLPVVEVDDNYSKSFSQEFYWLAKVCCVDIFVIIYGYL